MSILYSCDIGWVISHKKYIDKVYDGVKTNHGLIKLKLNSTLFDINSKFLRQNQIESLQNNDNNSQIKRKRKSTSFIGKNTDRPSSVEKMYNEIIQKAKKCLIFVDKVTCDYNEQARSLNQAIFCNEYLNNIRNSHGGNTSSIPVISKIYSEDFVFPENSSFYCYNIEDFNEKNVISEKFDFLLMDPPWWNKSVRRKKSKCTKDSYPMMYNRDLVKIPVNKLLQSNGIIAIWCTTSTNNLHSILYEMFPAWDITFKAIWYWIKVTKTGDTVCNFNNANGKQPYELLVIGSKSTSIQIPDKKVFLSVPSIIHSHKPPVTDIFAQYIPKYPKCIEIFARYLLPSWSSWGLEVLKFQHLSLFTVEGTIEKNEAE